MRVQEVCHAWVVYRVSLNGGKGTANVVCEQREWETIEAAQPGLHTLLHSGLKTEQEAERLARGTSGDNYGNRGGKKPAYSPVRKLPV
ncbi:hypothetical protein R5W24_004319 [Gemmata sp. JC717]|uniref:Uncharacterized protein n=1 Tax=Gemmata algarum TaxID=2975278 RepID=A0ABU5FAB2_9BACT|nr:hypothetical protein [Gemmata algarum]MDY3555181.1 hypothetical protein [Gemmata algarum]MDY3563655.1 hypothetical protein [Gemmata algarum]